MNIKAIIADVDGVMVGKKSGYNFPLPHPEIISTLSRVNASGVPIILCTAKFNFAIKKIAQLAQLDNPHITDGGALVMNLVSDAIIDEYPIDKLIVQQLIDGCLDNNLYVEIYSAQNYYIQRSQCIAFTDRRSELLQIPPTMVDSLRTVADHEAIIKIIIFEKDPVKQNQLYQLVHAFGNHVHFIWSHHPFLEPWRPGVITAPNASKANASKKVAKLLKIDFSNMLGIGDTQSDWNFMQLCEYVAAVGDKDQELQELVKSRGKNGFLAPSVDDHGLIEIVKHFHLI